MTFPRKSVSLALSVIPRHRPPFSLREFLSVQIGSGTDSLEKLEAKIAELLEMPEAILLPSARFGIWAGLRLMVPAGQAIAVPALNCSAVYEAAIRSLLPTVFVDCRENSLLMDLSTMPTASAWVLSELYGQTYELPPKSSHRPICIFDMAMTIPEKRLLDRLRASDLGLFSFGLGKSGYAGWGGVALTHDKNLAHEIHRMVQVSCARDSSPWLKLRRTLDLGTRVIAHWPPFYAFARKIQSLRHPPSRLLTLPENWFREGTQGEEWRRLPVRPELRMLAHNIRNFSRNSAARRELETHYRHFLRGVPEVDLPAASIGALSHFTIRVPASEKEPIRQRLWKHGFDAGDVIGLPSHCNPTLFPIAYQATHELINLPMGRGVTFKHVQAIASLLGVNSQEETRMSSNLS